MSRGRIALPIEMLGLRVAGYSARTWLVADLVTGPLMVLLVILAALLCRVFRLGTRAVAAIAVLLGLVDIAAALPGLLYVPTPADLSAGSQPDFSLGPFDMLTLGGWTPIAYGLAYLSCAGALLLAARRGPA
ncbi:hypothetical protein GCM10009530_23220 [Microbispora corallina]|uniref:Uncharacterized protein n=2 Tax=Microbispora corallina TaxID=83302 RepID=A0ABQ4G7C3_9ACTN|nr:hypothetical protein Mco01_59710 [Microbispora corallina]